METKVKSFEQYLYHEIDEDEKIEEYIDKSLPMIGLIVMNFNYLEQSLDSYLCKFFTDRTDSTGLIVLHKMNYSAKVDLFKRFIENFHLAINYEVPNYKELLNNLREAGRLRNLVVHADWFNTENDCFTYVNLKISKNGMQQEYIQFSTDSLEKIITLINNTNKELENYWELYEDTIVDYPNINNKD